MAMKIRVGFAVIALAWSVVAVPVDAALPNTTPVVAEQDKPTESEALSFVKAYSPSQLRRKAELNILERDFIPGLRQDPGMAEILDAYPTLGREMVSAVSSQVDIYVAEYDQRFFPRATAIVRASLSRADVLSLTQFLNSPLGQKMLALGADNVSGKEVMQAAVSGEKVDTGTATRQAFRAGVAVSAQLTPSENQELARFVSSEAGRHFAAIRPQLTALQIELINNPGPRFKAGAEKAMKEVFQRVAGVAAGQK